MQRGEKRPPPDGDEPPGGPDPPKLQAPTVKQMEAAFDLVIRYLQIVAQYIRDNLREQPPSVSPFPGPFPVPIVRPYVPPTPAAAPPMGSPPTTPSSALNDQQPAPTPLTTTPAAGTSEAAGPAGTSEAAGPIITQADETEEQQTDAPAPEPMQSYDDDALDPPDSGDEQEPTTQPEWNGTFLTSVEAASGAPAVAVEASPSGEEPSTLPPDSAAPDQPEDTLPPDS